MVPVTIVIITMIIVTNDGGQLGLRGDTRVRERRGDHNSLMIMIVNDDAYYDARYDNDDTYRNNDNTHNDDNNTYTNNGTVIMMASGRTSSAGPCATSW